MAWFLGAPEGLWHSLVHRPYAFALFALFAVLAIPRLGVRRTACMTVAGYVIAWVSELSSIHNGFPYGLYSYLDVGLEGDLRVLGVPFFDSLSYVFLTYFGWETAVTLVGAHGDDRRRRTFGIALLAALLTTLLDVLVDPISHLGDRWFLGLIYAYAEPGAYFGIPLSNFAGWFLVTFVITRSFQWIHRRFERRAAPERTWPAAMWHAPAAYLAVVAFALSIAAHLGEWALLAAGAAVQAPVVLLLAHRAGRLHTASRSVITSRAGET